MADEKKLRNQKAVLIRSAEISLKGKNRAMFEQKLINNIRKALDFHSIKEYSFTKTKKNIVLVIDKDCRFLKNVFGIASLSYAVQTSIDMEDILAGVDLKISGREFKTFRVSTKRFDKNIAMNSYEIDCMVGEHVVRKHGKKVNLTKFEAEIGIDIIDNKAYVYTETIGGYGGLPIGTAGKVAVVADYKDYELAAWYMMKRGCEVLFFGPGNIEFELINPFVFGHVRHYASENHSLLGTMEKELAIAGVVGLRGEDFVKEEKDIRKRYTMDDEMLLLSPLAGFSDKEIKEKIRSIKAA